MIRSDFIPQVREKESTRSLRKGDRSKQNLIMIKGGEKLYEGRGHSV